MRRNIKWLYVAKRRFLWYSSCWTLVTSKTRRTKTMSINRLLLSEQSNALFGIQLDEDQLDAFEAYYDAVIDANKEFNLTAITLKDEFVEKHFIDSLAGVKFIPDGAKVLDIGAGAGFPSFPIAVARPDTKVTALDSTTKKMTFVKSTAKGIGIKNLDAISGRAEEENALFEQFDVVTARAVSALPILLEICTPLLKVGGLFVAYKTDETELDSAKNALKTLDCAIKEVFKFNLPSGDNRAILVIEKKSKTPEKYPRPYGQIKKKPL